MVGMSQELSRMAAIRASCAARVATSIRLLHHRTYSPHTLFQKNHSTPCCLLLSRDSIRDEVRKRIRVLVSLSNGRKCPSFQLAPSSIERNGSMRYGSFLLSFFLFFFLSFPLLSLLLETKSRDRSSTRILFFLFFFPLLLFSLFFFFFFFFVHGMRE